MASFDYPLNVYVAILQMETGVVPDSLHYGLWQEGFTSDQAQRAATELLFEHLRPPCRILEAGVGLGTTAVRLVEAGYDYVAVCPDAGQIANARDRVGKGNGQFEVSKFEELEPQENKFDAVLFQESAQYIEQRTLLQCARAQLKTGGQLLIMDESPTTWLEVLPHYAKKDGFELAKQIDLTEQTAPTVPYLHDLIAKHYDAIAAKLRVPKPLLHTFCTELKERWLAYQDGSYRYVLLDLRALPDGDPSDVERTG